MSTCTEADPKPVITSRGSTSANSEIRNENII